MQDKPPLLKLALQLQQQLTHRQRLPDQERRQIWAGLQEQADLLLRRIRRIQHADRHGWLFAARHAEVGARDALLQLGYAINHAVPRLETRHTPPPIALRDLYEELEQLETEFGGLTLDLKLKVIAVITDAIELEDVPLGPFKIELHVDRLSHRANVYAFDLVALEPNPPDCSEDVTHPHVRDRQLCAGDATVPISQALESGRIADAFLAIKAVLETYNPGSPYVAMSDWHGSPCDDCGVTVDEDHRYSCEECNQICCEECIGRCDICESSFCRSCLKEDSQSGRMCCRSCRHRCGQCGRVVDADTFVDETELCPECHEERITQLNEEQEQDDEESNPQPEQPDSGGSNRDQSAPRLPDAA